MCQDQRVNRTPNPEECVPPNPFVISIIYWLPLGVDVATTFSTHSFDLRMYLDKKVKKKSMYKLSPIVCTAELQLLHNLNFFYCVDECRLLLRFLSLRLLLFDYFFVFANFFLDSLDFFFDFSTFLFAY